MGATASKNNENFMNRKEHLLEGVLLDKNGKKIKNVERNSNIIRKILRNKVKKYVEENVFKYKLNNKSKYNHDTKISSIYDYKQDNNYVVKLDISLYGDYLENGLEITKYVHRNSDIGPRLKENECVIIEIKIDKNTENKIRNEIKNVEKSKKINLNHLKKVFAYGESFFCSILVMEKLDKTLQDVLNKETNMKKINNIYNQIMELNKKLNNIGVCHKDPHFVNFMVKDGKDGKDGKWYMIDFGDSTYITNKSCTDSKFINREFKFYTNRLQKLNNNPTKKLKK